MANNGTGYDKYCKGWWDEGDPAYSRNMRDKYAIEDSIDSNDWDRDWDEIVGPDPCFCDWGTDYLCFYCTAPKVTAEQARLAARKKYKDTKVIRDPGGPTRRSWRRWMPVRKGREISTAKPVETCDHLWVERERWVPREGYTNYYTKVARPPYMVLHRYWLCKDCRGEKGFGAVTERRDLTKLKPMHGRYRYYVRGSEEVTREMTPQELKSFEAKKAKENRTYKSPKTYGVKDDGQPIYRNEFKQAPKKRLTRKREDDE